MRTPICVSKRDHSDKEVDNCTSSSSSQCTVTVHGFHYSDKEEVIDCLEIYKMEKALEVVELLKVGSKL